VATQSLTQENDPAGGDARSISRSTRIEDLPEFLRVDEFAAFFDLGRGAAYAMVRTDPRLRAVRFGRLLRIPRSALITLAKEQA
jgi:excisionase family DNA binding protein